MKTTKKVNSFLLICVLFVVSCKDLKTISRNENTAVPASFNTSNDTVNSANLCWREFYKDENLVSLIDSALSRNQELNIILEEIKINNNEIGARKGMLLPYLNGVVGGGVDKVGRYTSQGAADASTEITPGKIVPENLSDIYLGVNASWEIDVWKKLRNSKKAAVYKFLSSIEGKNFMVTNLISEIATSYYELIAFDNQLEILRNNIQIQKNALEIVKQEKLAAKTTELAVKKFEAEVLKNQSRQFYILQQIKVTENKINFLVGRFPQPIIRNSKDFTDLKLNLINEGIPSQLLQNRTDIKKSENELIAAKLDVKVARAEFYPSFRITSGAGFNAFNPKFFLKTPESMIYSLAGDMIAPLLNRNALNANLKNANSRQIQAIFDYEKTILNAHFEVVNQLSNIENLQNSFDLKTQQVNALSESIAISNDLFTSARADYMEVLMTQRDVLESKFELIEIKQQQLNAMIHLYQALGGGWR